MTPIKEKTEWMPAMEAAKLLKVHYNTIRQWMKAGRVAYKIGKYKHMTMALILKSSLKTAFDVKCKVCGKVFQSRRPVKTSFCCAKHRWAWFNRAMWKNPRASCS
jgi:hypothetical protein